MSTAPETPPGWEARPGDGFTAYVRGPEVHVHLERPGVVTRRTIKQVLAPVVEQHGVAMTCCEDGDDKTKFFLARLGFRRGHQANGLQFFFLQGSPLCRSPSP